MRHRELMQLDAGYADVLADVAALIEGARRGPVGQCSHDEDLLRDRPADRGARASGFGSRELRRGTAAEAVGGSYEAVRGGFSVDRLETAPLLSRVSADRIDLGRAHGPAKEIRDAVAGF